MVFQRSAMRYAHTIGYTNLIYTSDGEIITCGSDGDIRRWVHGIDDDDPISTCLGDFVISVVQDGNDRLLVSTDRNTVQAYTISTMDKLETLMRFTASVTCMSINKNYLAAGSEDTTIKIVIRNTENQPVLELNNHSGPLLALDISCKNILASIAGDGNLKISKLDGANATELKTISGFPKVKTFEKTKFFSHLNFEPKYGNSLAYAKGTEIIILNTSTWEIQYILNDEIVNSYYTCCRYSCDGQFIAAGTISGELSIFNVLSKQSIKTEAPSTGCHAITSLMWNPKHNNELSFCDAHGQLGSLVANNSSINPSTSSEDLLEYLDTTELDQDNEVKSNLNLMKNDLNNEDAVSIEKLKIQIMGRTINSDDKLVFGGSKNSEEKLIPKLFQQPPFQPSSSPQNLEHRYMVWNEVGIVTSHVDNVDGGSIDVDFHDVNVHHSLHLLNHNNHTMASLSSTVLALSGGATTKLVCIALSASGNKEWSVQFTDCESVEALVATRKLVAAATSMQFLRLFTVMGTQREVLSLPGPVICMAGFEHRLLVCYHASATNEKQQHLGAMLIQANGIALRVQQIPFPLLPGRKLTWLGFSDCGSPTFFDSMGLLQIYSIKSNCWFPVCDTMKHCQSVSNNFFIISVIEKTQIVQAVLCRGSTYPMTNPRPMIQEIPMNLPLSDSELEKADLEDRLLRASIMNMKDSDKIIKETAIKLFAQACRNEAELRAKELIEYISCPEILLLAVKYATKLGRIHLSDQLTELLPRLVDQNEREKQELQDFQLHQLIPFSPLMHRMLMFGCDGNDTYEHSTLTARLMPKPITINPAKLPSLRRDSTAQESVTLPIGCSKSDTQESEIGPLSPFNSLNPFASKRKLVDIGGTILNPSKFKFVKKSE